MANTDDTIKGAMPPAADKPAGNGSARPKPNRPPGDAIEWARKGP